MSPRPIGIRPASRRDIDALVRMHAELLREQLELDPEPPIHPDFDAERYFERRLATPGRWTLVAESEDEGGVVGYVDGLVATHGRRAMVGGALRRLFGRTPEAPLRAPRTEAYLANVYVTPEWRRDGVAARLVEALKDEARRAGATVMHVDVLEGNHASAALFVRAGFEPHLRRSTARLESLDE